MMLDMVAMVSLFLPPQMVLFPFRKPGERIIHCNEKLDVKEGPVPAACGS
jgi:hypothetical protein